MYRYKWVDSIVKISIMLSDKSGLRKKPKPSPKRLMKKLDFGDEGIGEYMKRFGFGKKKKPMNDRINDIRKEYEQLKHQ